MTATLTSTPTERNVRAIIKGWGQINIARGDLKKVRHLIYWCPPCHAYHLWEGKSFQDIEIAISKST